MSVQHVVLFNFDPELNEEDKAEMFAQVGSWPAEIGGFDELRLGPPADTERTRGFHYLLYMVVGDEDALGRYLVHPVHRGFAAWVVEHGGTVLAFDYRLDEGTVIPTGTG